MYDAPISNNVHYPSWRYAGKVPLKLAFILGVSPVYLLFVLHRCR